MKRKIAILVLTMLVVLSMTAVPAFAASKQVVELSNKSYIYNLDKDKWYQDGEWKNTYKNGLLKQYERTTYFRDEERPSKVTGTYAVTTKYTYDSKNRIKQQETIGGDWTSKNTYSYKGGHCKTQMLY